MSLTLSRHFEKRKGKQGRKGEQVLELPERVATGAVGEKHPSATRKLQILTAAYPTPLLAVQMTQFHSEVR